MFEFIEEWLSYIYYLIINIIVSILILSFTVLIFLALFVKFKNRVSTSVTASPVKPIPLNPVSASTAATTTSATAAKTPLLQKQAPISTASTTATSTTSVARKQDGNDDVISDDSIKRTSAVRGILQKQSTLRMRKSNSSTMSSTAEPSSTNGVNHSETTVSPSKSKRIQFFINENSKDGSDKYTPDAHNSGASTQSEAPVIPEPPIESCPDDKVRLLTTCTKAHTDVIVSVAFSPDGWFLATAGGIKDRCIKVWTRSSLVQVDKDGMRKACSTPPRFTTIRLDTGEEPDCAATLSFPVGHVSVIVCATQERREVKGWRISKTPGALPKLEFAFKTTHAYVVTSAHLYMGKALHFADPTMYIVTASQGDTDVRVWNLQGDKINSFETKGKVDSMWFSPSGSRIAITNDKSVKILNLEYKAGDAPILSGAKLTPIKIDAPSSACDVSYEMAMDQYGIEKIATGNCSVATHVSGKNWLLHSLVASSSKETLLAKGDGGSDGAYSQVLASPNRPIVLGVFGDKIDAFYASKRNGTSSIFTTASNETGRNIKLVKIAPDGDCFIAIDEDSKEFSIYSLPILNRL